MKQNVDVSCPVITVSLYRCSEPLEKCMTFKDFFHDSQVPGIFKKNIQDFPVGIGTLLLDIIVLTCLEL